MENIIVVEGDPVVWLDLMDVLQMQFATARLERLPLDEAMAVISGLGATGTALVTSALPAELAALVDKCAAGLRLVVTNGAANKAIRTSLANAEFIERPFDAGSIAGLLSRRPA